MSGKRFKVDAKAVLTLGRNSIKDATTAVVELVKNSYDADAESVDLVITTKSNGGGSIRLADNGHGMSETDVDRHWLRIGFSEKVDNKTSVRFQRRKTGEKGIGRLSADRLGAMLELRTKKRGQRATGLKIDWSSFEVPGREIGQVPLPSLDKAAPKLPKLRSGKPSASGTELIIKSLRQGWTESDIKNLHAELSLLLPPYPNIAKTFSINFHNDVSPHFNGPIRYGKGAKGEIEFSATLSNKGDLDYKISYFNPTDRTKRVQASRRVSWRELAPDPGKGLPQESSKLGKIEIRLSYFVRRIELLEATGLKLSELRNYLNRNAGVRIYRDMVRVKPYGDPDGPESDWLGLGQRKVSDPAGVRRKTFKMSPNQLVGAVFSGRDVSPELVDSSSREGLIENDAFRQLKVVLMRCINLIESKYHEISTQSPKQKTKAASARAAVKTLSGSLSVLSGELSDLQTKVSKDVGEDLAAVNEQISRIIEQAQAAQRDIDELADQNTVFRGLATVGIASAIFGHETSTAISQAEGKVLIASKLLQRQSPDIEKSMQRLQEALQYMERIASWGKFALSRVNKDKRQRRKVSVSSIVSNVLDELEGPMATVNIKLLRKVSPDVHAKTFPMDVEAVLINFLTNAYHEVKRHQGLRSVRVRLVEKKSGDLFGFEIGVEDNGGGIPQEHLGNIWEPLFSTKTDDRGRATGTGLGLAVVRAAVEDLGGSVGVVPHGPLGGAVFTAWIPRGV